MVVPIPSIKGKLYNCIPTVYNYNWVFVFLQQILLLQMALNVFLRFSHLMGNQNLEFNYISTHVELIIEYIMLIYTSN